jgi:hypothetical protein
MNKTKSFVDSSILLAGWRGVTLLRIKSLTILSQAKREFVSSPFVRLEVRPKAVFHKNADEAAFYDAFFENVNEWINDLKKLSARRKA